MSKVILVTGGQYNFITIENGIKKSVNWFIENYNNCRK